jgi:hypothetical protein
VKHGDTEVRDVTVKAKFTYLAVHILTADSARHLSTEDDNKGTFSLNCTSASNSVTDYSP